MATRIDEIDAVPSRNAGAAPSPAIGPLPLYICVGWGAGTLAVAALFNAVNVLLLRYLVDFVGIGATVAGSLIGLSKLYDALIDPLVGSVSDRWRSPAGRRRPFILAGGLALGVAALLLFNVPHALHGTRMIAFVVFSLLVYATAYATFSVPYMAMPTEMTPDYHERSRLMSFRVYATAIASLLAVFAGPVLIARSGGGQAGHTALSVLLAVIAILSSWFCFHATRFAPFHEAGHPPRLGFFRKLAMIGDNKPFLLLLAIKLCQLMALAVTQASMPFLFKRVLGLSDVMLGVYFLVFYSTMIVTQPAWLKASRTYGKRKVFIGLTLVTALLYISWYFVAPGEPIAILLLRALILGGAGGGVLLFGQSLLPDTMQWDYKITGLRREGILAGLYTVIEKLSYAMGAAITGIVLGKSGYIQAMGNAPVVQPPSAISAIYLLASFSPMILLLASCVLLYFYDLSEARLAGSAD
jgi:GPH family glycoside/pentoside/hexuronide:cation symporter